jgi:phage terminase Nu1 subunit (DNA packaging protein)
LWLDTLRAGVELLDAIVSKSEFARIAGVSSARVSQWLRDGVVTKEALVGEGRHARVRVEIAKSLLRDRLDPDRSRLGGLQRSGDDHPRSRLAAERARLVGLRADLVQIRVDRQRGELIPRADVLAEIQATGRAIKGAYMSIIGWSEEIVRCGASWRPGSPFCVIAGQGHRVWECSCRPHRGRRRRV